jgi:hypothetical protein
VSIEQLITEHLDIWTAADTEKKSGRGRGSANSGNVYGIKKLRELILGEFKQTTLKSHRILSADKA